MLTRNHLTPFKWSIMFSLTNLINLLTNERIKSLSFHRLIENEHHLLCGTIHSFIQFDCICVWWLSIKQREREKKAEEQIQSETMDRRMKQSLSCKSKHACLMQFHRTHSGSNTSDLDKSLPKDIVCPWIKDTTTIVKRFFRIDDYNVVENSDRICLKIAHNLFVLFFFNQL